MAPVATIIVRVVATLLVGMGHFVVDSPKHSTHTQTHSHVHSHQHTKSTKFVRDPTTQTPTRARRAAAAAANKRKVWLRRNSREISTDQKLADQFHPRTHLLHGRTAPQLLRTGSGHRWAPLRNSFSLIFTHFSAIGAPTVGSLLAGAFFLRTLLQSSSSGAFRIKHGGEICLYFSTWWWCGSANERHPQHTNTAERARKGFEVCRVCLSGQRACTDTESWAVVV